MPKYLDHHKPPKNMTPAMMQQMKESMGKTDQFGAKHLNVIMGKDEVWCLSEAPNAEAVHKGHEAMGIKLGHGDVTEVTTLV